MSRQASVDLSIPLVTQVGEVDRVAAALFDAACEGGGFFNHRTIHLEEIASRIAKIEESFDAVAGPRLGGFDAVVAEPGDHRQKIAGFNEKSVTGIFGTSPCRPAG